MSLAPSGDQTRPRLVKPFYFAFAELDHRIAAGRDLRVQLEHSFAPIPERLREFGEKYWTWRDQNITYLGTAFSTDELVLKYTETSTAGVSDFTPLAELLRDVALRLMRDIAFLVDLQYHLKAYSEVEPT